MRPTHLACPALRFVARRPCVIAEAKLQEKADNGNLEAAKLHVQWDEQRNQADADGPPFWQHACPQCGAQHSWQARVDMRLQKGAWWASCENMRLLAADNGLRCRRRLSNLLRTTVL